MVRVRATLFIYLRHIQLRLRDRKTDCAPRRCRATGIRDAICMQILFRRDSARGRIRTVANWDRARASGYVGIHSGPRTHARRVPSHLRPTFRPPFPVVALFVWSCHPLLPATRRPLDVAIVPS